jgi:hypothetical protein
MSATGGTALIVGLWYQSLGGLVALVEPWTFRGAEQNIYAQSIGLANQESVQLLLEYFDMDTAIRSQSGIQLVQFKVSSQENPRDFQFDDVRDILRNATLAILKHEMEKVESIVGFLVVSNRGMGKYFKSLQQSIRTSEITENDPKALESFAKSSAPSHFFQNKRRQSKNSVGLGSIRHEEEIKSGDLGSPQKTMGDFAQSITYSKAKEWGFPPDQCITACLKAMMNFSYASAQPAKLSTALHLWLKTWGVLPHEYEGYIARIVGELIKPSNDGKPWDSQSIMCRVFDSSSAQPITLTSIWPAVIRDLRNRNWPDPPTRKLVTQKGTPAWMLDRSDLLLGLPYSFLERPEGTTDPEDPYFINLNILPRIFTLVGPGGVGKSGLLAQLFTEIGGAAWDWETNCFKHNPKFIGYPVILEPDEGIIEGISGVLKKWGGRNDALDYPIERLATANNLLDSDSAVWVGIDGLDEIPDEHLNQLARSLANCADSHPEIRLVLTSRPEQFDLILPILNAKGLHRKIPVYEFNIDQARDALTLATNGELRLKPQTADILTAGQVKNTASILRSYGLTEFERSIRQPLLIGVVRRLYEKGKGLALIQDAYNEDAGALRCLATEYMYTFCERVQRRLNCSYVTPRKIFKALKQLASKTKEPQKANRTVWMKVCESELDGLVPWGLLIAQCAASGLIQALGNGAFEWRHPFVGRNLPTMEENPAWQ